MENSVKKIRVLHLEDVATDAYMVAHKLKAANIEVDLEVVDNRENFITALQEFKPEVILSDHNLPTFNSLEALNILKNLGIRIPFILVTGAVSEEFAATAIKKGAEDYILKDRLQRLPTALLKALEKYRFFLNLQAVIL